MALTRSDTAGDEARTVDRAPWLDPDAAYRAISGRDPRFDGRLYVGVVSTGVYCRPSCPARTPRPENCRFYPAAAAAVAAGFRACRRCRPDSLPGSRDWDVRGDLAARAVRAISDGVVDEAGVDGLAARLHVSPRHLHRVLVTEMGASPLQLARTRRAQLARMLLDQTDLPMADVAFAAGFASVRQFNDVVREHFAASPTQLRRTRRRTAVVPTVSRAVWQGGGPSGGDRSAGGERQPVDGARLSLRLRYAEPFDVAPWFRHVADRAVTGLEQLHGTLPGSGDEVGVTRLLRGAGGPVLATLALAADGSAIHAHLTLADLADLASTVARLRRWLDLDADPALVAGAFAGDPLLGPLVAARPGLRVPGTTDPFELAVRAVLGQQVSTSAARTVAGRLVAAFGEPGPGGLSLFPTPDRLAGLATADLRELGLNTGRAATIGVVAQAVADGLTLDPGADRTHVRNALLALPGVGPWTADYVALRALGDPDVFPAGDLVLRRALAELPGGAGAPVDVRAATDRAAAWSPWRGYAAQHLWSAWSARPVPVRSARGAATSENRANGAGGGGRMDA